MGETKFFAEAKKKGLRELEHRKVFLCNRITKSGEKRENRAKLCIQSHLFPQAPFIILVKSQPTFLSPSGKSGSSSGTSPMSIVADGVSSSGLPPLITSTPLPPTPISNINNNNNPAAAPDPKFTTWATVNCHGARVVVPECGGVAITVPPGALNPGQAVDIFLSVSVHTVQAIQKKLRKNQGGKN